MPLRPARVMNPYLNDWFLCCRQTSFHVSNLSWSDTIFTFLGFQINLTVFSSPPHWFFQINFLKCFWINLEPLSKGEPRSPDIHYYIIIGLIYLSLKDCYNVGFQNSVEPERGLNRKPSTLKLTLQPNILVYPSENWPGQDLIGSLFFLSWLIGLTMRVFPYMRFKIFTITLILTENSGNSLFVNL